jgi:hypothetical protein
MEVFLDTIKSYEIIVILIMIGLIIILILMQILNKVEINRIEKRYKKLMKGSVGKNLEEMIFEYNSKVDKSLASAKHIEDMYLDVDNRLRKCIQKISVIRYRAFDDVGSDLSYSIAILDDYNNGLVITGIYGRSESTSFTKPIENGISKYDLSEEEKLAIRNAINNK